MNKGISIGLILLLCSCIQRELSSNKTSFYETIDQPEDIQSVPFEAFSELLGVQDDTVRIINFWATWCAPCVAELPYLEQASDTYANHPVAVYLISLDFPQKIGSKLLTFVKKHKIKSTVIHLNDPDANAWIDLVDASWSGSIPATLIYQRDRSVFHEGSFENYEELDQVIKPFLQ